MDENFETNINKNLQGRTIKPKIIDEILTNIIL